jgi:hypothetical protein
MLRSRVFVGFPAGRKWPEDGGTSVAKQAEQYETPELIEYGTVEEWTRGPNQIIISIIIGLS